MSDLNGRQYAFIGDLHGRTSLLEFILSKDKMDSYHFVLVGDILHHKHHFRVTRRTSPICMLSLVYSLIQRGKATLIAGNNENYILKHLVLPDHEVKKREAKYTLKCLKQVSLEDRVKYINMLSSAPVSLELDGRFRVAHAYYKPEERESCLYGPGYAWFKDEDLTVKHSIDPNYIYIHGHYGLPYLRQNIKILDATKLEAAGVYYSDRDEFTVYY